MNVTGALAVASGSAVSERFVAEGAIVAVGDADAAAAEVVAARRQDGGGLGRSLSSSTLPMPMPALPLSRPWLVATGGLMCW